MATTQPRKIFVPTFIDQLTDSSRFRVAQPGYPSPFVATPQALTDATGIGAEAAARIAADNAEKAARIAADDELQTDINVLADRFQAAGSQLLTSPPGTTSATFVMVGLDVALPVPLTATRVLVILTGQIANSNNGGSSFAELRYGTGTPPANGDPDTGTPVGGTVAYVATSGGGSYVPFSQNALIVGLPGGTSIWVGVAMKAAAGTASLQNLQMTAVTLIDSVVF